MINNWSSGYPFELYKLPLIGLYFSGIVIVPGLFGIAIVCKIDSTTRLDA